MDTEKENKSLLRAIHSHCRTCSGGVATEVSNCRIRDCNLYEFREGKRDIGKLPKKASRKPKKRFGSRMSGTKSTLDKTKIWLLSRSCYSTMTYYMLGRGIMI
jgi:hypothetical protein